MTDLSEDAEWPSLASTAEIRWIELNALQRDLLELFYRQDRQSDTDTTTLTDAAIRDELAERYGDAVPTNCVESVLADLVDRSLLTTISSAENDEKRVPDTLTSTGRVLFAERVVSLTSLLTDEKMDADGTEDNMEGQS